MLRSFWFWLFFIIALFVIWMARDRITEFVETLPVEQPARTTNTQILAQTLTPRQARTATAQATSTSVQVRAATTPESGTSPRSLTEVYIIQSGDTLYSIAQRFGTDVDTLIQLNKIWDPTSLIVGEEILIPKKPTPAPTPRATQSVLEKRNDVYIVQPGDTMTSIAQKHGVSVTELVRLNNISNPNNL
ncbi:MAG: LysM peptidoglycan-binding domain-containing protein, partial [Caldilineae bacterium]